jgi:hypothetical protein
MRLLESEFLRFLAVLGVLWLIIESALGIGVLPLSKDINPRILYYILLFSFSYNIASLLSIWIKHSSDVTPPHTNNQYETIRKALTDNDFKVLQHLERRQNELPSQTFSAVFPGQSEITEFDPFTRRLVHLTSLGLINTIGSSEIEITVAGLEFLKEARQDPKYQHLLYRQ